jgi:hypothetical protein
MNKFSQGAAGYDAAFQITPSSKFQTLKSVTIENGKMKLELYGTDRMVVKAFVAYDAGTKMLKGIPE